MILTHQKIKNISIMSNLQKYFNDFHETIKLGSENDDLRTSRDAIKNKLSTSLKDYFESRYIKNPIFFDQGSYAMGTGIKPVNGDCSYDIDEGVKFDINTNDFPDPVEIKKSIKEALSEHTDLGTKIKQPCVRVIYSEDGKEKYHIDLAIYATNGNTSRDSIIGLGRGKEFSNKDKKYWQNAQPELFIDLISNRFDNKYEKSQFQRVIRYLKRWKDLYFSLSGNSAPRGIALTVLAYKYFNPSFEFGGGPSDIDALINFVNKIKYSVVNTYLNGEYVERLVCRLPLEPYNDLFAKMSNKQMKRFLKKLNEFNEKLISAKNESIEDDACLTLGELFGYDFPSPDISKAFCKVKKPEIGYFPTHQEFQGFTNAPYKIRISGYLYVKNKLIPIPSNKNIIGSKHKLEFHASSMVRSNNLEYYWRVVNTGKHAQSLAEKETDKREIFRGGLDKAHLIKNVNGDVKVVPSDNRLITQESTSYTGKHWIECLAFKNSICVAKSKPFYVNIYNSDFPYYD